ncbi:MAG: L-histidine N(alpha)-methyltransferase [Anaerolineae bacterium]|nr:L-histidine N(alpha)-methyltransferase [Anaerolineae bacterium]
MDELVVFCDRDSLEAEYLTEFVSNRRVPQNLFYLMNGADSFYSYRNGELELIPWRQEYDFFVRQSLWTREQSVGFVSLGCGNARPEQVLLRSLHADGYDITYIGVDSSEAMLTMARGNLEHEGFRRSFVLADFGHPDFASDLRQLIGDCDSRLFAMIGATFGNFDQTFIADLLGELVPPNDYVYLDVVPMYQEEDLNGRLRARLSRVPENLSRFFDRLLATLGLSLAQGHVICDEGGDGDLHAMRFTFLFEVDSRITISCLGGETDLLPGERIELLSVRAYDVESLKTFMEQRGFRFLDTYIPDAADSGHLWQRLLFVKTA